MNTNFAKNITASSASFCNEGKVQKWKNPIHIIAFTDLSIYLGYDFNLDSDQFLESVQAYFVQFYLQRVNLIKWPI